MESVYNTITDRLLITRFDEVHQLARDNIKNHFILDLFVPSSVMDDIHTRGWNDSCDKMGEKRERNWNDKLPGKLSEVRQKEEEEEEE